jgi:hypothetical protein
MVAPLKFDRNPEDPSPVERLQFGAWPAIANSLPLPVPRPADSGERSLTPICVRDSANFDFLFQLIVFLFFGDFIILCLGESVLRARGLAGLLDFIFFQDMSYVGSVLALSRYSWNCNGFALSDLHDVFSWVLLASRLSPFRKAG